MLPPSYTAFGTGLLAAHAAGAQHGGTTTPGAAMSKGKSKYRNRNGSESNKNSRASASDRKHDDKQVRENKSTHLGADNSGKLKDWQGGSKKENRQ
jgi:hypothetical protein